MTIESSPGTLLAQEPTCPRDADGRPRVFVAGDGAYLTDPEGRRWIDLDNARGSVVLGHADEEVAEAVSRAARGGFGAGTSWSPLLDRLLGRLQQVCGGDSLALFRTGTAALRSVVCAVRDARERPIILSAGYHGYDPMWHCAEPFAPNADGVVEFLFDLDVLAEWLAEPRRVAAVVISPDHMHLGERWYSEFSRLVKTAEVPLVADEVKVGLRYRGGLSTDALDPDVWVVAKCLANGAPVAAAGGDAGLLAGLAEVSFTSYFEPTVLAAADVTLARMATGDPQQAARRAGDLLIAHARRAFNTHGIPIDLAGDGNLFQFICADNEVAEGLHAAAAAEHLLLFEGDNQTPSAAFTDSVVADACSRIDRVAQTLAGRWDGRELTEDSWYTSAWGAMDGLADRPRTRAETAALVNRLWED